MAFRLIDWLKSSALIKMQNNCSIIEKWYICNYVLIEICFRKVTVVFDLNIRGFFPTRKHC